jgi:hypothetical protein
MGRDSNVSSRPLRNPPETHAWDITSIRKDRPENKEAYRSFQHSVRTKGCGKAGIRVTQGREQGQPQELSESDPKDKRDRLPHNRVFRLRADF